MKKSAIFVIVSVCIGSILCCGALFAEHTGPGKYNNEDLKLGEPPRNTNETTAPDVPDKTSNEKKGEETGTQDKEYWCRQGTALNKTISDIKIELDRLQDEERRAKDIDKAELPPGGWQALQERLIVTKWRLGEAERALSDFEGEARMKGVPPGWIKCNF